MPAGTGAWMLANRGTDGRLTLSPRSHAYGGTLQLRSIVLIPLASEAAALDLYRHNSLDVARVPPGRVASTKDMTDFHISDGLDAYYLEPAQPSERLTGADLDRTAVLQKLEPALAPLAGIVPPAVPDYVSSAPGDSSTHAVTLKVVGSPTGDPVAARLSRAIRASETGPAKRVIPVRIIHVRNSLPDPGVWLGLLWDQSSSRWYRRSLGHAASLTNDPVSRMDLYSRVEDWALQRGLLLPLASGTVAYLVKSSVQSLQVTPLGLMPDNNNWSTVTVG
jgi:ABC-type oligopeptide transport system substrate-binding subunit